MVINSNTAMSEPNSVMIFHALTTAVVAATVQLTSNVAKKGESRVAVINETGFNVDLNQMTVGKRYPIRYDGSLYEVAKNDKGELELYEVGYE